MPAPLTVNTKYISNLVREPQLRLSLCRDLISYIGARAERDTHQNDSEAEQIDAAARFDLVRNRVTDHLRHIIKIYGWPGKSMVGPEGAGAASCIVLFADHDLDFQKRCLTLMVEAGPSEVAPSFTARLTDRILVAEGKPQVYGTQFRVNAQDEYGPAPINDAEHVDERRTQAGLKPLAEQIADRLDFMERWDIAVPKHET